MVPGFLLQLKDFISQPWPWYVAGPMIALTMFLLLWFGREFGISANFRVMCAADGADDYADFFQFDWSSQSWNLMVALGAMFGGYIAANYFFSPDGDIAHVSAATVQTLNEFEYFKGKIVEGMVPMAPGFYSWSALFTWRGLFIIAGGGLLVGFGARYAGGCTSGHAISGMSALQLGSLIAVIGFFLGGLVMTHLIFPLIF